MIVVLGMHRSGTSLVAGILHELGVRMGSQFRAPDSSNPSGYYEDLDFRDLNKRIINGADGTWWQPPSKAAVSKGVKNGKHDMELATLMIKKAGHGVWGFKDPRTCLTIHALAPLLDEFMEGPSYIVVDRNIDKIVKSLEKRSEQRGYQESHEHWVRLCQEYQSRIDDFLDTCDAPVLRVSYNKLTDRMYAESTIRSIAMFAGVGFKSEALDIVRFRPSYAGSLARSRNHDYRKGVGSPDMYDVLGAHQFCLLRKFGIRQHHTLLDVGCGSLRAGRLFIVYLNSGNYFGVEPNMWMVRDAFEHELGRDISEVKLPIFSDTPRYDFEEFGVLFNYALANSIFTHAPPWQTTMCFNNLGKVMAKGGQFFGTFIPGHKTDPRDEWLPKFRRTYRVDDIQRMARVAGFSFDVLRDVKHPTRQTWFLAKKT